MRRARAGRRGSSAPCSYAPGACFARPAAGAGDPGLSGPSSTAVSPVGDLAAAITADALGLRLTVLHYRALDGPGAAGNGEGRTTAAHPSCRRNYTR